MFESEQSPRPDGNIFERMMFRKVDLWVLILLSLIGIVLALLFGAAVRYYHRGGTALGEFGAAVDALAALPSNAVKVIGAIQPASALLAVEQRFAGQSGFAFHYAPGSRPDLGYVLLNRYNADRRQSVVELRDLNTQQAIHEWHFGSVDGVWSKSQLRSATNFRVDRRGVRFRPVHALLLTDGRLVAADTSPMVEADVCSSLSLFEDSFIAHHSIEQNTSKGFWVPIRIEPKTVPFGGPGFWEDGIAMFDSNGETTFHKSLVDILSANGLSILLEGRGPTNGDPTHLNDVEPVIKGGEYWKEGDVFLSLRHQSMVILYRPATGRILWYREGPWVHQHDVDVIDDHRIMVFDNNAVPSETGRKRVRGTNRALIYDFRTDTVTSPWQQGFSKLDLRTPEEGLADAVGSEIMVEETLHGRLVQFAADGRISWQFVNRAKDGRTYYLNWSRYIPRALGDEAVAAIRRTKCD